MQNYSLSRGQDVYQVLVLSIYLIIFLKKKSGSGNGPKF